MITSKVTYTGGLRTEAVHFQSGAIIYNDAPKDNHGQGEAFSPSDMIATALATCILTTIGIVAMREGFKTIDGSSAEVTKVMYTDPRRVGEIHVKITFPAMDYSDKEKKIYEHIAYTCPVAASLHADLKQVIELNWL